MLRPSSSFETRLRKSFLVVALTSGAPQDEDGAGVGKSTGPILAYTGEGETNDEMDRPRGRRLPGFQRDDDADLRLSGPAKYCFQMDYIYLYGCFGGPTIPNMIAWGTPLLGGALVFWSFYRGRREKVDRAPSR